MLPIESDQISKLLEELNELTNQLAKLLADKEFLLVDELVSLEAEYMNKVGHLEFEVFRFDTKLKKLNRKIEIVREKIANDEPIDLKKIDEQIEKEFSQEKEEEQKYDERMEYITEEEEKEANLSEEAAKSLKEMYYLLAKKLHPDINPNVTEKEIAIWHRVQTAYENKDIEEMTMLFELYEEMLDIEIDLTKKEEIEKRIEKIRALIQQTLMQLAEIQAQFPFTHKQDLKDPDWVFSKTAVNKELLRQLKEEYNMGTELLRVMLSSVGIKY